MKKLAFTKNNTNLRNNKSSQFFAILLSLQNQKTSQIIDLKKNTRNTSKKLLNPSSSLKTYWSVSKTFLNNKIIPVIPPVFQEHKFMEIFKKKAEVFYSQFALVNNISKIPQECPRISNEPLSLSLISQI